MNINELVSSYRRQHNISDDLKDYEWWDFNPAVLAGKTIIAVDSDEIATGNYLPVTLDKLPAHFRIVFQDGSTMDVCSDGGDNYCLWYKGVDGPKPRK